MGSARFGVKRPYAGALYINYSDKAGIAGMNILKYTIYGIRTEVAME